MISSSPHRGRLLSGATAFLLAFVFTQTDFAAAQCSATSTTPAAAADCAAHNTPIGKITDLDPTHEYSLAELIDIAEHNNPRTRIAWEQAKQRAAALGLAKSAYYPLLAGIATLADSRAIEPFPKPLAPRGYTMAEATVIQPELALQYLVFDFGGREARVDVAKAEKLAAGANFIQENQTVAFQVASAYYKLVTAQERLEAARETLKTAQTTQDAAEGQLANGRSTMPDVLNARAATSQAVFDMESADGDEKISRVTLAELIGVEPSPNIVIDAQKNAPLPSSLTLPIDSLIDRALIDRPDLAAQAAEIRAADASVRVAKTAYLPSINLAGTGAETSLRPSSDYGQLGSATEPTWTAEINLQWRLFDGGARKNDLRIAESRRRQAQDEMTELHDKATREVWTAYISFRTALRQQEAAVTLLESANASYSASLEAYKYGVKNIVDVVTAERQLEQARFSDVSARSRLFLEAVDLEFVTGNLLRHKAPATQISPQPNQPQPTEPKPQDGQK